MLNSSPSASTPPAESRFSFNKLPWRVFGLVLLVHVCVLWWVTGVYFGRVADETPQPIFITLEAGEPEDFASNAASDSSPASSALPEPPAVSEQQSRAATQSRVESQPRTEQQPRTERQPRTEPQPRAESKPDTPSQTRPEAIQPQDIAVELVPDKVVKQPGAKTLISKSASNSDPQEKRVSPPSVSAVVASPQLTPSPQPGPRVITRVQYLSDPPRPVYPALAKSRKQQGKVIVRVLISPDGLISTIRIHQSSGFETLDEAAIRAFADVRFKPYSENGIPYERLADIPIEFLLRN